MNWTSLGSSSAPTLTLRAAADFSVSLSEINRHYNLFDNYKDLYIRESILLFFMNDIKNFSNICNLMFFVNESKFE